MPSVRYYNQTAPFWDFVANMEEQGANHPFFGQRGGEDTGRSNPWANGWNGFPFGPFPHRPRHEQPHQEGQSADEGEHNEEMQTSGDEKAAEAGPSHSLDRRGGHEGHRYGRHHGAERHGHGGRHGFGMGGRGRHGGCGGRGGRGRGGHPFGGPGGFPGMGGFGAVADMLQSQLFGENNGNTAAADSNNKDKSEDFKPEADVFDTNEAFVVHVSLPGAKKEDVGVNWDSEKSELNVAGVIYRPGDEELLKTLALDERKVGAFERKIRLGSRANPAQVDVDGITAKMEDGVLRVEVPKLDSGYVEIRKVDIE